MGNLLLSLGAGAVVFAILAAALGFAGYAAAAPAVLVALGVFVVLARRSLAQLQALSERAQKELVAQRIDRAIEILRSGFPMGRWQFWVTSMIHAELGSLLYVKKDFEAARPHLEKSFERSYFARAMLACYFFNKKEPAKMREQFEVAVKHGKKDGLVWSLYAYCHFKLGEKDQALKVLARASEENPSDEKLKANLLALQNNKKMKMKGYVPQFYQFHLEPLPQDGGGGRRVVWERR